MRFIQTALWKTFTLAAIVLLMLGSLLYYWLAQPCGLPGNMVKRLEKWSNHPGVEMSAGERLVIFGSRSPEACLGFIAVVEDESIATVNTPLTKDGIHITTTAKRAEVTAIQSGITRILFVDKWAYLPTKHDAEMGIADLTVTQREAWINNAFEFYIQNQPDAFVVTNVDRMSVDEKWQLLMLHQASFVIPLLVRD